MTAEIKKEKSVRVPNPLLTKLGRWYDKQLTKTGAENIIGVNYRVIDKTLLTGTCSPDTKTKIENFFNN